MSDGAWVPRSEDSEFYHSLVEHLPVCVYRIDLEGRIVFGNAAYLNDVGRSLDELLGKTVFDVFPEDEARKYASDDRRVLETGEVFHDIEEHRVQGRTLYVEVLKSRVHDRQGRPSGVQGVYWDVTARKRSEDRLQEATAELERSHRALQDSQAMYHSLVEQLPVCVYRVDPEGRLTFGNSAYLKDVGRSLDELIGKTVYDLFPEEEARKYDADDRWVMDSGMVFQDVEEHYVRGEKLYVEVLKSPVYDHLGQRVGVQGLYWDVTARKRAEEQLQKTLAELERSNKELQQFAAVASHDMHAPLRRLVTLSQIIQGHCRGKVDPAICELLQFMASSVAQMQELIEDLLAHSRVGAPNRPLEAVDCNSVVAKALSNLSEVIEEGGVEVEVGELPTIVANRVELVQLFQNLIGNAVKYRNAENPRIEVRTEWQGGCWLFHVKDNGIGIPEKDRDRVFEAFQRLHGDDQYPGTGIGLATCKKIVEHLDGRIWVQSHEGKGCEFLFTLPARTAKT
ncbi:MAG: sensor histidine kinase [Thermoguttaceae bacterium]